MLEPQYRWLLYLFGPIGICVAALVLCFRPFWIPSGSMQPTLRSGDYMIANRAVYGFPQIRCFFGGCSDEGGSVAQALSRGDVVVFRHPVNSAFYVNRVIGLSGDEVQMVDGAVVLNGVALGQNPIEDFIEPFLPNTVGGYPACGNGVVELGEDCVKQRFSETLDDDLSYEVLNVMDAGPSDNTDVFNAPEGHIFVLGDNRDNSLDSRHIQAGGGAGFVPVENLIGRAELVLFNFSGVKDRGWTWLR